MMKMMKMMKMNYKISLLNIRLILLRIFFSIVFFVCFVLFIVSARAVFWQEKMVVPIVGFENVDSKEVEVLYSFNELVRTINVPADEYKLLKKK